jgi:hypothetical protein
MKHIVCAFSALSFLSAVFVADIRSFSNFERTIATLALAGVGFLCVIATKALEEK